MSNLKSSVFPYLLTERLSLRQLEVKDEKDVAFIRSDDKVNQYLDRPKCSSVEEARDFILKINDGISNNSWFYWAITLKNDPKLIGTICLWNFSKELNRAEIGYELHPSFHGRGLMNEALKEVIEFGFKTIQLDTIEAWTVEENKASIKVLLKNGFQRNVERENSIDAKEKTSSTVIYSLERSS